MGDTVAHAARAPEEPEPAADKQSGNHPPSPHSPIAKPAKRNVDVLSAEGSALDAELSRIKMELDAKLEALDNNDSKVDSHTGSNSTTAAQLGVESEKSTEEDLSMSKDGSSENISSIEIDTSVGNDVSFSANVNNGRDDASPKSSLEIDTEESKQIPNSDSLNGISARDFSTEDITEADARSLSESGFVEGSTVSEQDMENAGTHPECDKARGEGSTGGSLESGDKSVPCDRTVASGILPAPGKTTMEEELQFLRQEVRLKSANVQRLQTSLYDQQARANLAVVALRTQLRAKDRHLQQARGQHEQRMSALLSHLLYLEGQMRQEQRQVLELLHEKDDVIRRQKSAIEDLATKNARLLAALKEVHGYSGGNGISTPNAASSSEEGGRSGVGAASAAAATTPVVLRNKDKSQKVRFGSVKDKLRRHKSSLELHRPTSLDTLVEGTLRYGSQEDLSKVHKGFSSSTPGTRGSGGGGEGLCSDELKKTRQQERKERCKSLIDYPFRLNDLPEVSSEVEKGRDDSSSSSPLPDPLHQSLSPGLGTPTSRHGSSSSPTQVRRSLYSDDEEAFLHPEAKQYGELAKASSMPQSLASPSSDDQEMMTPGNVKERPHSLSGVELSLNMEKMSMLPMEKVSMNPSPTSQAPPGGSESNPFKSFKNVFRRRNSKQRSKKRPASLGQQTNQEYHEALKEHFKKYDLN